jgi:hypothetical protein
MRLTPDGSPSPPQQDEQPSVAEPSSLIGEIAQSGTKLGVRRSDRPVADHLPIGINDRAGPTFRQAHHGLKMRDRFALDGGPYH